MGGHQYEVRSRRLREKHSTPQGNGGAKILRDKDFFMFRDSKETRGPGDVARGQMTRALGDGKGFG